MTPILTLTQARHLHLATQGLLITPRRKATPQDLRQCIQRMQLLQIDTIHVVARSPYLVLFSRLGAYPPACLDAALASGQLFEIWAHEACFAPVEDVLLHRSYNQHARRHWGISNGLAVQALERTHLDALLAHIGSNGPVKSSEFARTDGKTNGGWWDRKDEKRWLEALFASGELMVARRDSFQRVYDLAHRVHPVLAEATLPRPPRCTAALWRKPSSPWALPKPAGSATTFTRSRVLKTLTWTRWWRNAWRWLVGLPTAMCTTSTPGCCKKPWTASYAPPTPRCCHPSIPLVWDRERASTLWGFDYRIECYTPEEKCIYGYFVLLILHRGVLVGRLDAKAHRALGVFEVKALFVEAGVELSDAAVRAVAQAIQRCADWHGTLLVRLGRTVPEGVGERLRALGVLGLASSGPAEFSYGLSCRTSRRRGGKVGRASARRCKLMTQPGSSHTEPSVRPAYL